MATVSAYYVTGLTVRAVIRNAALEFVDVENSVLVSFAADDVDNYDIACTEIPDTGEYHTTWPSWLVVGLYTIQFMPRVTDPIAGTDFPNRFAVQSYYWDGTNLIPDWAFKITLTPIIVTVSTGVVTDNSITIYQHDDFGPYVFVLVDSSGDPVDVSESDFVFSVYDERTPGTILWTITSDEESHGTITVSGANQVTVTDDDANTGSPGLFRYNLRDTTNNKTRARGRLDIQPDADS